MRLRTFDLYCGNFDCPSRTEPWFDEEARRTVIGRRFECADVPDGETWYCPDCRKRPRT